MRYFTVIAYDGTRYRGWQRQGNTGDTVSARLEAVLSKLDGDEVTVEGAGRTDAGVHAMGQGCTFTLHGDHAPEGVEAYLNEYLPEDIAVLSCEAVQPRFHARLSSVGKVYRYEIRLSKAPDVFRRKYQWHLGKPLDVGSMERAAKLLCGTHDYKAFCTAAPKKRSTVRTVRSITFCEEGGTLVITFCGDGFLYNMVRIMVGTLVAVGRHELDAEAVQEILLSGDRAKAGPTAPAQGLCLMRVLYP
ncbi:MAG: tRNA pseudouridine(38-40) synthase TruA [Clostridia bacterium]|nr:tRNA pseudouridine(38-40) synthase TruA [Clostridia bacterium]